MTTQNRKETESGTAYYDVNFHILVKNPIPESKIREVEAILNQLVIESYNENTTN